MKKIAFLLTVILFVLQIPPAFADETIEVYSYDYNDGLLENVTHYKATAGSIRNQGYYTGNALSIKDRNQDGSDKYVELKYGEEEDARFMQLFPKPLYGRVVVEADLRMDHMTANRTLFKVFSHDEQNIINIRGQIDCYELYFERTNVEMFDIPIDKEWHHFRAEINTDKDNVIMYIDGVPCFSEPVIMNRGARAKKGVSGFESAIAFNARRGDVEGTTGIDNVRAYVLSDEKYTDYYSDELKIDYEYNMISGVTKGMTVGELLGKIKYNGAPAEAVVCDAGVEKDADEYIYAGDELILTRGQQREFISIHLDNSTSAEYYMLLNSPEILKGSERLQIDDNNSSVTPVLNNGDAYMPVSVMKDLFGAEVKTNADTGYVTITREGKALTIAGSDVNAFSGNGTTYYKAKELFEYFNIRYSLGEDGLIMLGGGDFTFKNSREREYVKDSFIMKAAAANAAVINAGNDIQGAFEKAAVLLNDSDVIINLDSNVYNITDTITLPEYVTKNKNHMLYIRGSENKHAQFVGGVKLTKDDFQKVPDNAVIKKRLPEISADKVVMVNLKQKGITDLGQITPQGHTFEIRPSESQLFVNGSQATMARYPNEGFIYTGEALYKGYGNSNTGFYYNEFQYTDKRVENWAIDDNIWMFGFWSNEWTCSQARLKKLVKERSSIIADGAMRGAIPGAGRPYFYFNVLEELDQEGEYVIDFNTGYMYYYPKADFDTSEIYISNSDEIMLQLEKSENVVLENIDFKYCRNIALKEVQCKNVLVRNCAFTGIGTYAVMQRSCVNSGLYGCDIYETGAHSVQLEGGCMFTLTDSDNFVINSRIRENGTRRRTYSGGVLCRGSGNYIYRNSFRDSYHMGVYVFGTNHMIKNNNFSNMCYMSGDAGAVYMAGKYYNANINVIGNYFENMSPHPEMGAGGNVSVYYDNSTSHTTTYGNIMYDTVLGVQVNCGRKCPVFGNIMSDLKMRAGILGASTNDSFIADYNTLRMTAYKSDVWEKLMPQMRDLEWNYNPREPYGTDAYSNLWENSEPFTATKPKITLMYDNVSNNEAEKGSAFMDKPNKDFRLNDQAEFNNTYIMGDVEYMNMGTGADFVFGNNSDLERVYIATDISASNRANMYINKGEAVSLKVLARDTEGNIIDNSRLAITYSTDNKNVAAVSEKGVLYGVGEGNTTINVTVAHKGKSITSKLNVYTDTAAWRAVDIGLSDRPVSVYYNDELLTLQNKCIVDKGMLLIPAEEILSKIGYTQKVENGKYIYTFEDASIEITPNDVNFRINGKAAVLNLIPYVENDVLYVPFTMFEDLGILNIYNDADKVAYIYNVNLASGGEKIPEGVEVVKLSEFIKDTEGWTSDVTARYNNTGSEISFGSDSSDTSKVQVLGYKGKKFSNNTMYEFEYEWNSDTFTSFNFRIANPSVIPWRATEDSYYVLVKPDAIEIQKRVNQTTTFILDNVANNYLKPGVPHKISIGIIDTEDGPRCIVNSDGHNIIDVVDKINYSVSGTSRAMLDKPLPPVAEEGYISFVCYTSAAGEDSAYVKIR